MGFFLYIYTVDLSTQCLHQIVNKANNQSPTVSSDAYCSKPIISKSASNSAGLSIPPTGGRKSPQSNPIYFIKYFPAAIPPCFLRLSTIPIDTDCHFGAVSISPASKASII